MENAFKTQNSGHWRTLSKPDVENILIYGCQSLKGPCDKAKTAHEDQIKSINEDRSRQTFSVLSIIAGIYKPRRKRMIKIHQGHELMKITPGEYK